MENLSSLRSSDTMKTSLFVLPCVSTVTQSGTRVCDEVGRGSGRRTGQTVEIRVRNQLAFILYAVSRAID
jgi:hypothetical protein